MSKRSHILFFFSIILLLIACGGGGGSDSTTGTIADPPPTPGGTTGDTWVPSAGATWWWQLEDLDNLNTTFAVDVYDVDLFGGISSGAISRLNGVGVRIICYFSAGTFEDFRPDAGDFTQEALIENGALGGFPDEIWLNLGNADALENNIKPIMRARLDLAQNNGCDGVEADNVDGFANVDETFGFITTADQLSYNRWLAAEAHQRNLSIGLKNDLDQLNDLVADFDFAVNEQCYAFGNECVLYENNFLAAGKAVFNQEYFEAGGEGVVSQSEYENMACPNFLAMKISSLWKVSFDLDGRNVVICQDF